MKTVMKEDVQVPCLDLIVKSPFFIQIFCGGKFTLGSAGHLPLSGCWSIHV